MSLQKLLDEIKKMKKEDREGIMGCSDKLEGIKETVEAVDGNVAMCVNQDVGLWQQIKEALK